MKEFLKKFALLRLLNRIYWLFKFWVLRLKWKGEGWLYDWRNGVVTERKVPLFSLGGVDPHKAKAYLGHEPTGVSFCRRLLRDLPLQHNRFEFVDIGSGMGRTVFIARELPFRKITGIEFYEGFHNIARKNLNRLGEENRLQLICGDALEYEFGTTPLLLYLYNPFHKEAMEAFLRKLHDSLENHPRPLWIVYVNPRFHKMVAEQEFIESFRFFGGFGGYTEYIVYRGCFSELPHQTK